jgi:hypothetical protein
MAPLCALISDCITNDSISIGAIIGIVVGVLCGLAALIIGIVFLYILCKKKRQPSVVWFQSPVYPGTVIPNQPVIIGSYSQGYELNGPPPAYQGENYTRSFE